MSAKRLASTAVANARPKSARGGVTGAASTLAVDRTLIRVAVTFFVVYAVLQTAIWYLAQEGLLQPLATMTADITGACTRATGIAASVSGTEITLSTRILRIDLDCTGVSIAIMYAALVLAYPLSLKHRLVGLALGVPLLFTANMLRLLAVAQLSELLGDRAFLFAHDYLFKIAMIAAVIGLWGAYLAWARRHAAQS